MQTNEPRARGRVTRYVWLGAGVVLILAAVVVAFVGGAAEPTRSTPTIVSPTTIGRVARRETRPTLDPVQFVGKAAGAHQVAREIPDALDQLYCYCECDKHLGHKSLLSCYTDGHAAT
jgi:hypothetical protein